MDNQSTKGLGKLPGHWNWDGIKVEDLGEGVARQMIVGERLMMRGGQGQPFGGGGVQDGGQVLGGVVQLQGGEVAA